MERKIMFRGKRVDNGEWRICSSIEVSTSGITLIGYEEVNPKTVGQFTGLLDKNGKEIYEGDVILATHIAARLEYKCVVEWHGDGFVPMCNDGECAGYGLASSTADMFHIQVIGNIHDNPELLKSDSE